jgi:hypothetical protein
MSDNLIRSRLLYQLTASPLVVIAIRGDTGSFYRFDLIQSLIPTRYLCNGYVPPRCFKGELRDKEIIEVLPHVDFVNIKTQR